MVEEKVPAKAEKETTKADRGPTAEGLLRQAAELLEARNGPRAPKHYGKIAKDVRRIIERLEA